MNVHSLTTKDAFTLPYDLGPGTFVQPTAQWMVGGAWTKMVAQTIVQAFYYTSLVLCLSLFVGYCVYVIQSSYIDLNVANTKPVVATFLSMAKKM